MTVADVILLGSGMAAVGASYRLRQESVPHVTFDMRRESGGHTSSHRDEHGFVFDEGPHISFTKDERIKSLLAEAVDGQYLSFPTRVNNYWQGYWLKHPAQCNLHGLPPQLVAKIIEDMFDARADQRSPTNYEEWLVASYGATFAEQFPMQYGRKYHTVEARNMSLDWLGQRLYRPSMTEVLIGALTPETADVHYISKFRYPAHGGFGAYLKPFHQQMQIRPWTSSRPIGCASQTPLLRERCGGALRQSDLIAAASGVDPRPSTTCLRTCWPLRTPSHARFALW